MHKKSPNIGYMPLNPEGALELGLKPCDACNAGWGTYSMGTDGKSNTTSCRGTCEYWKRYMDSTKKKRTEQVEEE